MSEQENEKNLKKYEISFKPLFITLIDKNMNTADLRRVADVSPSTMTEIRRHGSVTLDTIVKICAALECPIEEVVSIEPVDEEKNKIF
jgi:DNA (cytosine-5)-methyltransferase 1